MLQVEDAMGRSVGLYFLATAVAGAGELSEAVCVAEEGLEVSEPGDMFARGNLNTLLGIAEWLLDDPETAESQLKEALRTQDGIGHRWGMGTSLEGLAWVAASSGRLERAALLLGASASLWQELGNTLIPNWQPHHEASDAAARDGLGEARYRARWEEGFALPRGAVVAAALEERLPDDGRTPAVAAEDAFELTGRELEVARLVADGLSNPDIASTLFVSRATVKTHVSHILKKLALDSRVQLATWVAAHDPGSAAPSGG
jgi:non-specific serine/threonine protein kinase